MRKNVLPFSKKIRSIAVIGVDATEARLGGYSGPGNNKVSILEGLKEKAGSNIKVMYAPGCGRTTDEYVVIPSKYLSSNGKEGLQGEYFNNVNLSGEASIRRIDKSINFHWTLYAPDPALNVDFYSVSWTGKLTAPQTGNYKIGLEGNDGYRLYINNKLVVDNWKKQTYSTRLANYSFEKNKSYDIRIEFFEPNGNATIKACLECRRSQ